MTYRTYHLASVFSLLLMLNSSVVADEGIISILDTSGITRASSQVDQTGNVDFNLADASGNPAQGIEVTLTNQANGETLNAISENGVVSFAGLAAGAWTVACATPGVTFTSVGISSAVAGASGAAGAIGAGAIGSGAGAAAGATGAVVGTSAAVTGGTLLTAGGVAAAAAGTAVAVDEANDDDDDDPLSPFS